MGECVRIECVMQKQTKKAHFILPNFIHEKGHFEISWTNTKQIKVDLYLHYICKGYN